MALDRNRNSDLGVRTGSALVMVAVAGAALWLGGVAWMGFALLVAAGVYFEWGRLVRAFAPRGLSHAAWMLGGAIYVGVATVTLVALRDDAPVAPFVVVLGVIATDIGAYFSGRAIGGPKIAPSISPSKTWAGLFGGMIAAGLVLAVMAGLAGYMSGMSGGGQPGAFFHTVVAIAFAAGAALAIVAQAGDFFESWMKRRAGVKDSGKLIPGHGGLFDRVDGLVAVLFVVGIASWVLPL